MASDIGASNSEIGNAGQVESRWHVKVIQRVVILIKAREAPAKRARNTRIIIDNVRQDYRIFKIYRQDIPLYDKSPCHSSSPCCV